MNVTQFLVETADALNDPGSILFPEAMRVRIGDRQVRSMFRTLTESNKQYSNFTMAVRASVALEPIDNVFDYRLPQWIMAVTRVWIRPGNAPASAPSFSLYQWTSGAALQGTEVPKTGDALTPRWGWQGSQTIRLENFSQAQELILEVVVRPAQMMRAKITTVNASAAKLYLPAAPEIGTLELEVGAYVNSDWQVTTTGVLNAPQFGEVRRCIYSDAANLLLGARTYELSMDSAYSAALAVDDVVETILAIPDEHTRLLVLRVAQSCLHSKGNLKALQAIDNELIREEMKFVEFATPPRDKRGPSDWKKPNPNQFRRTTAYPYPRYYGV